MRKRRDKPAAVAERLVPVGVVASGFAFRLLIATTDHLGPTARRTDLERTHPASPCAGKGASLRRNRTLGFPKRKVSLPSCCPGEWGGRR